MQVNIWYFVQVATSISIMLMLINRWKKFIFSQQAFMTGSSVSDPYTRRQINQDRMIFGDFSVNSEPIFLKFCKGHLLFKS